MLLQYIVAIVPMTTGLYITKCSAPRTCRVCNGTANAQIHGRIQSQIQCCTQTQELNVFQGTALQPATTRRVSLGNRESDMVNIDLIKTAAMKTAIQWVANATTQK